MSRDTEGLRIPRACGPSKRALPGRRSSRRAAGMDDCVTKPIRVDALVDALLKAKPARADAGPVG